MLFTRSKNLDQDSSTSQLLQPPASISVHQIALMQNHLPAIWYKNQVNVESCVRYMLEPGNVDQSCTTLRTVVCRVTSAPLPSTFGQVGGELVGHVVFVGRLSVARPFVRWPSQSSSVGSSLILDRFPRFSIGLVSYPGFGASSLCLYLGLRVADET